MWCGGVDFLASKLIGRKGFTSPSTTLARRASDLTAYAKRVKAFRQTRAAAGTKAVITTKSGSGKVVRFGVKQKYSGVNSRAKTWSSINKPRKLAVLFVGQPKKLIIANLLIAAFRKPVQGAYMDVIFQLEREHRGQVFVLEGSKKKPIGKLVPSNQVELIGKGWKNSLTYETFRDVFEILTKSGLIKKI